ncbi:MAG: hypothetical protein JOZ74_12690 [Bradyrhizobium sp.]|nr:hypothetical protein [Bradyrhizobium sp.]
MNSISRAADLRLENRLSNARGAKNRSSDLPEGKSHDAADFAFELTERSIDDPASEADAFWSLAQSVPGRKPDVPSGLNNC